MRLQTGLTYSGVRELLPYISFSISSSCFIQLGLGRIIDLLLFTNWYAYRSVAFLVTMRYMITMVADLDFPTAQCTSTFLPFFRDWLMKSMHSSKQGRIDYPKVSLSVSFLQEKLKSSQNEFGIQTAQLSIAPMFSLLSSRMLEELSKEPRYSPSSICEACTFSCDQMGSEILSQLLHVGHKACRILSQGQCSYSGYILLAVMGGLLVVQIQGLLLCICQGRCIVDYPGWLRDYYEAWDCVSEWMGFIRLSQEGYMKKNNQYIRHSITLTRPPSRRYSPSSDPASTRRSG